jgi:hypothetical protein
MSYSAALRCYFPAGEISAAKNDINVDFTFTAEDRNSTAHDLLSVYFCLATRDALGAFQPHFQSGFGLARLALDRLHRPSPDLVSGRAIARRSAQTTWTASCAVHVPGIRRQEWFAIVYATQSNQRHLPSQLRIEQMVTPWDTHGRLAHERTRHDAVARDNFVKDRLRLQVATNLLENRPFVLPVELEALSSSVVRADVSRLYSHNISSIDRQLLAHCWVTSRDQVTQLGGHFYRFLMSTTEEPGMNRFCPLRATTLTIPIELSAGIRSSTFNAFVTFLTEAHAITQLHRNVDQHHGSDQNNRDQFDSLGPSELLEAIVVLCGGGDPSIYGSWNVTWLDFILLSCVDAFAWRRLLFPHLTRWLQLDGARPLERIAKMLSDNVHEQSTLCQMLVDETMSCYNRFRHLHTAASAILSVFPVTIQHMVLEPFGANNNGVDNCHYIPVLTPKAKAARQIAALAICASIGDEAGQALTLEYFHCWHQFQRFQKDSRRRNLLIKAALDRKFAGGGNLQHRYFRKWLMWFKLRRMKAERRRRTVLLPSSYDS